MSPLEIINHHAILFIHGDRKNFVTSLWEELRTQSIAHILREQTVIDIDTARSIITWANTPYEGEKTMLLSFHTITVHAQNALLKILEEPHVGVKFVLVTTNKESLIPTLLSRLQVQEINSELENSNEKDATMFLKTNHSERIKLPFIVKLLNATDEEDRKDREGVRGFILSLATKTGALMVYPKETAITLEMATYSAFPSSSLKSILEYLALLLPQTK